jgi:cyclic di-GMP phosphodiesterase
MRVKKRVPVDELRLGMYVAELDRPWTETPFVFQGFILSTPQQIEMLRNYCSSVFIDVERSAPGAQPVPGRVTHVEQTPVDQEMAPARTAHLASKVTVEDLIATVRIGGTLDAARVREAVTTMTDSVLRNPDALLLYSQLKERGDYAVAHALDVSVYMITFGRFLELERSQIEFLGYLGLLQDIGKVRLPKALMEKRGRFTKEEYERAKLHVDYSAEILRSATNLPPELARAARLHHERQDGSGYPARLHGGEIGTVGAIAAIVDSFDAMTIRRPYAEPLPPSAAISALYKARGTLYDGELVEQFIRCIGIFPVGSIVRLNSGETAIVIAQNPARRLQPRLAVIQDASGNPLRPQKLLNLAREPKIAGGERYCILHTLEYGAVPFAADELFMR